MSRFLKLSYAALAITMVSAGCTERAPRSFVQPNVIKKTDLVGTWYYLQTITDAPPTSSFLFIGNSSELQKIKFDIQEETLFARRAYEQIQGSEDAYRQDPAKYAGQPLAAWPIKSQFDIIRDYNATTGEETNRIIESTERPWNEREFIRVDWSNNLLTDADIVGLGINFFFQDGVHVESASYWESDPTKPDAFHMERADDTDADEFDKGEANYFDVTNKWVVTPTQTSLSFEEGGQRQSFSVPTCFLAYETDDCSSQIVKVRHAFAKISPKHQYEPRNWDGKQMNLFGIWDVGLNRLTYNRQYGVTNSGFQRHAARFNLWKQSYQADKTPIPFDQRETRTIPYYAEATLDPGGFPAELFDTGGEVVKQWNEAVSNAAKLVMGKDPANPIFVWCHNPVKLVEDSNGPKDNDACKANIKPQLDAQGNVVKDANGNPIYQARQGDPRRSNIFWVNQEQNAGPLGYGPPLFDIETGETISGQAYIYGAALDTYAARSRDLVLLILGKIDPGDYIAGQNVKDFVTANRSGNANRAPLYNQDQINDRIAAMNFKWAKGLAPEAKLDTSSFGAFMQSLKDRENAIYSSGVFGQDNSNLGQIRRDHLRGGQLEGMMVNSDVLALGNTRAGSDWSSLSDAEKARVSPLRSAAVTKMIEDRLDRMRAFGYDFADFADEGLAQRAFELANDPNIPNLDPEAIRQKLRKDIFLAVTLHEVGHNMGLRHNFRASWDAMNYFPDYWKLRSGAATSAGAQRFAGIDPATGAIKGVPYAGTDCSAANRKGTMRPRYIDCAGGATSVDEVKGHVREFQYSSIMDYGAEFNSDLMGLGQYDKAAMKFSYSDQGYVEVFTDAKQDNTTLLRWAALHAFQNAFGFPSPIGLTQNAESINYTTYPNLFKSGVDGIQKRKDVPYSAISGTAVQGYYQSDADGNPLVPYYFCSDEFVGNLTCQRFDSGADAYEQSQDIISRYENFYLLNNFKRDRYTFHTSLGYKSRIAGRYLEQLRNQLTWYALLRADFEDFFGAQGNADFFNSEDGWQSFGIAVTEGFDAIGRTIVRPGAGSYKFVGAGETTDYPVSYLKHASDNTQAGVGEVGIGLIDGKFIDTTWDFNGCGYYWADECQTRIGYFIDKTIALDVLSDSQAYFTGRDTSTDVRKYAIGYFTVFKGQLQEKIGALLSGDYTSLSPRVDATDPKNAKVTMPSWTLDLAGNNEPGMLIDPSGGFTLQLYAGVYGLSSFPTTFDHDFVDTTRIFVVGNGEAPVPDSSISCSATGTMNPNGYYCITDTYTGKSYAAKSFPMVPQMIGGTTVMQRQDTGVRMLQQYKAILDAQAAACPSGANCAAKTLAAQQFKENIDVMRSLHNAFGYAQYKTDAPFIY